MSHCLAQGDGEPSGSGDGARGLGGQLGLAEFDRGGRERGASRRGKARRQEGGKWLQQKTGQRLKRTSSRHVRGTRGSEA